MQSTTFGSLIAAAILALGVELLAAVPETYQVTGPVLEVNDNVIAVQKGKDGGNRTQFERQILKRKHSPTFVSALRSIVHRRVCPKRQARGSQEKSTGDYQWPKRMKYNKLGLV